MESGTNRQARPVLTQISSELLAAEGTLSMDRSMNR